MDKVNSIITLYVIFMKLMIFKIYIFQIINYINPTDVNNYIEFAV